MPTPICYASKDIVRVRIATLTQSGAPRNGAGNGYVTDATVSVQRTPRVDAGQETTQRNGGGVVCQYTSDCDTVVGQDLTVALCTNDLKLISMMTGAYAPTDGTGTMGYLERGLNDGCPDPVCFEWWSVAWDGGAQAVISGAPQYFHRVVPWVTFVHDQTTYERGLQVVTLKGKGNENGSITVNGPYNDWPTPIVTGDGLKDRSFGEWREATVPAAACATITVTSSAS